jgi:hypothetical protein
MTPSIGTRSGRPALPGVAEHRRKLPARVHSELAVGLPEVPLNGLGRDEQSLRDLPIREALRSHLGDSALARGQHVAVRGAAGSSPRRGELLSGALSQRRRAALAGQAEAGAEPLPCRGAAVGAAERGAEIYKGAGVVERGGRGLEHRYGFLQSGDPLGSVRDQARRAQRDAEGTRGPERARQLELIADQVERLVPPVEPYEGTLVRGQSCREALTISPGTYGVCRQYAGGKLG